MSAPHTALGFTPATPGHPPTPHHGRIIGSNVFARLVVRIGSHALVEFDSGEFAWLFDSRLQPTPAEWAARQQSRANQVRATGETA